MTCDDEPKGISVGANGADVRGRRRLGRRCGSAVTCLVASLTVLVSCSTSQPGQAPPSEHATARAGTALPSASSTGSGPPQALPTVSSVAPSTPSAATSLESKPLAFAGLHMVGAGAGWAITNAGILYTTDGGETWAPRGPDGADPAGLQPAPATHGWGGAAFAGSGEAWVTAAGPGTVTVFHTSDAGRSWSSAKVDPEADAGMDRSDTPAVIGLTFPTPNDGWLLVTAGGIATGSQDIELYRTADAGATWKMLAAAAQEQPSPSGLSAEGVKTGIGFAGPERGWITGYRGTQPGMWLYETGDGGRSWHTSALPTPPGISTAASPQSFPPIFTTPDHGIIPVTWPGKTSTTVFYATSDGGTTWHATTPIESADPMQAWSWPTAGNGLAASDTSWCATNDAAATWHCRPLPTTLGDGTSLNFVSPLVGWATSDKGLFTTVDEGHTWTSVAARPAS